MWKIAIGQVCYLVAHRYAYARCFFPPTGFPMYGRCVRSVRSRVVMDRNATVFILLRRYLGRAPSTLEIRDPLPHWALRPPKRGSRDRWGYSYTSSYGGHPRVDAKVRGHLSASRQEYRTLLCSLDGRPTRSFCAVRGIPFFWKS